MYYEEATHNQTNKVWDQFNKEKNYTAHSVSVYNEKDDQKANIGHIEDKYVGEAKPSTISENLFLPIIFFLVILNGNLGRNKR